MAKAGVKWVAWSVSALTAVGLGGCAGSTSPQADRTAVLPPFHVVPGSLLLPAAPSGPAQRDTCGASALATLVGKPRTQIPVPVDLSRRRVVCTACPVAPDVRMDRLNIFYDARTGLVTKVSCG
jgi:hypothetical protein